jgi:hypothetical protein
VKRKFRDTTRKDWENFYDDAEKTYVVGRGTAILICGVNTQAPSMAQDAPSLQATRSPIDIIKMFDTNGDKRLDRSEIRYKNLEVFDRIDVNRDNSLSPSELPRLSAATFSAADLDKNGKLSVDEYVDAEFLRFSGIDTNNDDFVTSQEISAFQNREKSP